MSVKTESRTPRVLPAFYVLMYAGIFWLIDFYINQTRFDFTYRNTLFYIILSLAALVIVIGGLQFRLAKTTVNPLVPHEASALVTSGIYRYSRNPMYVGFALVLLAWAIYLGNYLLLLLLAIFIWHITMVQIIPEEKALIKKFGQQFTDYMQHTRRWL